MTTPTPSATTARPAASAASAAQPEEPGYIERLVKWVIACVKSIFNRLCCCCRRNSTSSPSQPLASTPDGSQLLRDLKVWQPPDALLARFDKIHANSQAVYERYGKAIPAAEAGSYQTLSGHVAKGREWLRRQPHLLIAELNASSGN